MLCASNKDATVACVGALQCSNEVEFSQIHFFVRILACYNWKDTNLEIIPWITVLSFDVQKPCYGHIPMIPSTTPPPTTTPPPPPPPPPPPMSARPAPYLWAKVKLDQLFGSLFETAAKQFFVTLVRYFNDCVCLKYVLLFAFCRWPWKVYQIAPMGGREKSFIMIHSPN